MYTTGGGSESPQGRLSITTNECLVHPGVGVVRLQLKL